MPDRAAAEAFVDAYRRTFETFDVDAIEARFAFPLQVCGDAGGIRVDVFDGPGAWRPQLERITGANRVLGARSATLARLDAPAISPGIAHAVVRWSLVDADGTRIYWFTGSYTLADGDDGPRIVAIAHDEGPRLQMALAKARGGRPA